MDDAYSGSSSPYLTPLQSDSPLDTDSNATSRTYTWSPISPDRHTGCDEHFSPASLTIATANPALSTGLATPPITPQNKKRKATAQYGSPTPLGRALKRHNQGSYITSEPKTLADRLQISEIIAAYAAFLQAKNITLQDKPIHDHSQRVVNVAKLFLVDVPPDAKAFAAARARNLRLLFSQDKT
jgi:hypothetical protein